MIEELRAVLRQYEPKSIPDGPHIPAAVLLLLQNRGDDYHVLFQKRTSLVEHHKGQISFPGGGRDPGDADLLATALRETHEEIGVEPGHVEIVGRLDDMVTISNFRVSPYVGILEHHPYEFRLNEFEVERLLAVPVRWLLTPDSFREDRRQHDGREVILPSYVHEEELVWGATAHMLTQFLELARLASTRLGEPAY